MKQKEMYIFLDKLTFYAYHGVGEQETIVGNTFIIDLKLKVDFSRAAQTDDLRYTVSYADVYNVIKEVMSTPSKLLEHVGERIVCALFDNFASIEEVKLKLAKQNPPMGADIQSAGIESVYLR